MQALFMPVWLIENVPNTRNNQQTEQLFFIDYSDQKPSAKVNELKETSKWFLTIFVNFYHSLRLPIRWRIGYICVPFMAPEGRLRPGAKTRFNC